MARPIVYDEALRERLIELTAEAIAQSGVSALSLRAIAAQAHTSTSAIYSLFGSKEQLIVAVVDSALSSFERAQNAAEPRGLAAIGYAYREWALQNPALYLMIFGGRLREVGDNEPSPATAALQPLVRAVASHSGIDSNDPRAFEWAILVWSNVHGAVSLELSGIAPAEIPWRDTYERVIVAVHALFDGVSEMRVPQPQQRLS